MTELFGLITKLDENALLRLVKPEHFTARDISDLAFLYILSLHVLRSEFETAPFARQYAQRTMVHGGFTQDDPSNTDLYQFLHIISDKNGRLSSRLDNKEANDLFWPSVTFTPAVTKQMLNDIAKAGSYKGASARRWLMTLEQQLHVTNSNYRSMRRLMGEWNSGDLDTHQKRLAVTRMLQALRTRARRGDLLPQIERLSSLHNYELEDVCNAETGHGCGQGAIPPTKEKGLTLMKTLAIGAGMYAIDRLLRKGI